MKPHTKFTIASTTFTIAALACLIIGLWVLLMDNNVRIRALPVVLYVIYYVLLAIADYLKNVSAELALQNETVGKYGESILEEKRLAEERDQRIYNQLENLRHEIVELKQQISEGNADGDVRYQ